MLSIEEQWAALAQPAARDPQHQVDPDAGWATLGAELAAKPSSVASQPSTPAPCQERKVDNAASIPSFDEWQARIQPAAAPIPSFDEWQARSNPVTAAIPSFDEWHARSRPVDATPSSQEWRAERLRDPACIESGWAALGAELDVGSRGVASSTPSARAPPPASIEDGWAALGAELEQQQQRGPSAAAHGEATADCGRG
jgi:hypothetical protein